MNENEFWNINAFVGSDDTFLWIKNRANIKLFDENKE